MRKIWDSASAEPQIAQVPEAGRLAAGSQL